MNILRPQKVTQVLYPGLGGHGSVAFSLIEENDLTLNFSCIFYGIEPLKPEYEKKCHELGIDFHSILKKPGLDICSYWNYLKFLRRQQPQIILLHSVSLLIPTWLFTLLWGKKLILIEHQDNAYKRKSEWIWTYLSQFAASKIVYLTESYKTQVQLRLKYFYRSKKVSVIPNGVANTFFVDEVLEKNSPELRLTMMSRFTPLRDHKTLLLAFEKLSSLHPNVQLELYLAGNGATWTKLKEFSKTLSCHDRVIWAGMLEEQELVRTLQKTDIYVHCSLAETMSTAIMQAMAQGLPIIASDIEGIRSMIGDGLGILVPNRDVNAWARAMEKLILDSSQREAYSHRALAFAKERYSASLMFARYKELF